MSKMHQESGDKMQQDSSKLGLLAVLVIVVCAVVLAAHWPALSAQALSFDDYQFLVDDNPLVQNPSWASAKSILTEVLNPSAVGGYYQPLPVISVMLDYAMGGNNKNLRVFHRTNLAFHVLNTVSVIILLYSLFGQPILAVLAGLLFGIHPLAVEPVTWISERKTLLAMLFALWCMISYVHFARKGSWKLYAVCIVMYLFALMSKPTSLPLPVLMLLMDYWPLERLKPRAVIEKIPFFVLGGIFTVITIISNTRSGGLLSSLQSSVEIESLRIPLVVCYLIIFYLYKIIWPVNLSSAYALPEPLSLSNPVILIGVIGTIALIAVLLLSTRWTKALVSGWLFFFVAVLPTLGLIRFSFWVFASDKYVYMPVIGLLMVLVWGMGQAWKPGWRRITISRAALVGLILLLSAAEFRGVRSYLVHWRDTVSLCEYMLKLAPNAAPVHNMLGLTFQSQGKLDEAVSHYLDALRADPRKADAHNNLGSTFLAQGKLDEAITHLNRALQLRPRYYDAHNNLGIAFESQGKSDEAISHYLQAININPNNADAHYNLANVLQSQGKLDEAVSHYLQSLKTRPGDADAHYKLANTLQSQDNLDEAMFHYRQALRLKPDWLLPLNRMAMILAAHPSPMKRNPAEAIALAERAAELTGHQNPLILSTLAGAYAASGQIDLAVKTAQTAKALAESDKADELVEYINKQLELYSRPAGR